MCVLAEEGVASDVVVGDGAFVHHHVVKLFEFLEQSGAVSGVDAEAVEVHIDF